MQLQLTALGQTGFLLEYNACRFLIDPYLSEYVADKYGKHLQRLQPSRFKASELADIDALFMTHAHEDHCDPLTIRDIVRTNPICKLFGSFDCEDVLTEFDISLQNFSIADKGEIALDRSSEIQITTIPSAHTELSYNSDGCSQFLGYIIQIGGTTIYHAGDTIPHETITEKLKAFGKIDWALLPVNERNHFRDREGIIGNMSPREALQWADEIGATNLIPTHWDTFAPNTTHRAEVELLHELNNHKCNLHWLHIDETLIIQIQEK